ncbi:transcriptional regulator [Solitalea longa]|uniref:Transcriptional regulator n=1 Tax=Solitalea longa TaxID=2079460 RepID=A0A2S5A3T9_9SPHI|nr:ATP-binding protein [Solitalea longa]POY36783.1 transcriptional regulator [Solitalea longa]
MNKEDQNIEWKESWRDEYIKWIAGFANANGGVLYIGKNDSGNAVGIANAAKLLEDIPNKVRDVLGILVEVNLLTEDSREIIEIKVDPYPYPINYKGEYHYRSGSTKQELKGVALNKFILQKSGKHWDGIPIPNLSVAELDTNAFENFKKRAKRSKRVNENILDDTVEVLLENLHLIDDNQLKKACSLLFYHNPEKFTTGAYIKIGFFESDSDLIYQDEIHGNLFDQVEKTMDLLLTKYMSAQIRYEGLARIEEYPYPEPALREALLNAVAHKDYASGIPIQISVYKDKLQIWNEGHLPLNWTLKTILMKHPSKPSNPDIANTFFRAGMIESWGRGISKIISECQKVNLPIPQYATDFGGLMITFSASESSEKSTEKSTEKSMEKSMGKSMGKIVGLIQENPNITIADLSKKVGITPNAIEKNLSKLKKQGKIERIGPDKGGYWKILN